MISGMPGQFPVEFPRWQESSKGIKRPEEHDTLLVYVGQRIIELGCRITICLTQLHSPPLEKDFQQTPSVAIMKWA
jgi:hypothetical protein